jgi:hypothetical protein
MITQQELKEQLHYDPNTGIFTRLVSNCNRVKVGDVAGCVCSTTGYLKIYIHSKPYKAHRLAFLYMTGSFPEHQADHINHNRIDNIWSNLREVTNQENQRNCKLSKNNTSGVVGVYWDIRSKAWVAQIAINRIVKKLGRFKNKQDAITARKEAEIKYGFHKNHGVTL